MAFLRFFKVPKHQQFEYKPRYWDPKKEELQERLKRIELMKGGDTEAAKARIAGGFRRGYVTNKGSRKKQVLRSNLVLVGIILLLLLLSYMFLTVYLPEIAKSLENGSGKI